MGAALPRVEMRPDDLDVRSDWLGPGYGVVTADALSARRQIAATEGLDVETTYGAKALAAALAIGRAPEWRGRAILFWHTYSSADPARALERLPDWRELPPAVHDVFAGGDLAHPA
jgi:hypothetical protein